MRITCIGGGPAGRSAGAWCSPTRPWARCGAPTQDRRTRSSDAVQPLGRHRRALPGPRRRSGGHGFCGIGRMRLLNILQARCEQLGVELRVRDRATDEALDVDADLVIASDGI